MDNLKGYKRTEIGVIPTEWDVKRIDSIFKVETGTTPSTRNNDFWENGTINWITPYDLSKLNGSIYIENSTRKITVKGLKDAKLVLLPPNSIVISTRAPVGYVAINKEFATFNQGCKGLIPRMRNRINSEFYTYYLLNKKEALERLSGGSTFKELSKENLKRFKIPLPPLPEQKKIAEILSTVDKAIEKVDESIAKTERLKKGLMQKLLTEGIGHKEFKETEIGRIPNDWKLVKIKDIGEVFTGKTPSTSKDIYWNGDIPFITPEDMTGGKYVYKTNRHVTIKGANKSGKILPPNTILVVCIGSTVGKVALTYKKSVSNQQINSIICKEDVDHDYIYYAIVHKSCLLRNYSGVAAVPIVKKSLFEEFKIPLPERINEQQKIAEILSTTDNILELLNEKKERLTKIKKGLMNVLLTGKVRVKV